MKKILFLLPAIALIYSCHKDPANQPATASGKLVSLRAYQNGSLSSVDTFVYNGNGYLQTQREWSYNSGSTPDSFTLTLNYAGSGADPVSYTLSDGWGVNTYTLSYDSKGRLAKDTIVPDQAGKASTFFYPNNAIVYNSADNGSTDTLYLANNNVVKTVEASIPPDPTSTTTIAYTYSPTNANPLHTVGQTQNVRVLLTKIDNWEANVNDYISEKCITSVSESGFNMSLTYTTDASGRVVRGNAMNVGTLVYGYK